MMVITFLGTGNCCVDPVRGMASIALRDTVDAYLLDAGPGAIHACLQGGISLADIKGVFITHFHVDHVLDLVQLLWLRHLHAEKKGGGISAAIPVAGPPGFIDFIASLQRTFGKSVSAGESMVEVVEMKPSAGRRVGPLQVQAFKSRHTDESLCFRIAAEGRLIAYSGDSGPCEDLVLACRDADVAILECSYDASSPVETHMGPEQCASVAAEAGVKHLVLTHLPAGIVPKALKREIHRTYRGKCTIAEDFMEIRL